MAELASESHPSLRAVTVLVRAALVHYSAALARYPLDGFVTDHVSILQEIGQLYRLMAFFEPNLDKRWRLQRRRANLYEPLLDELSPRSYWTLLQMLLFELGETYGDMADIRKAQRGLYGDRVPPRRINELVFKGIRYMQAFIKSFEREGRAPEDPVEESFLQSFLAAHFTLAQLFSKLCGTQPGDEVEFWRKTLIEYEWIVRFLDMHNITGVFVEEADICRQMVQLLPLKILAAQAHLL